VVSTKRLAGGRTAIFASVALTSVIVAHRATAEPAPAIAKTARAPATARAGVHLSWVRTETAAQCPDASRLEAEVTRRLGRPVFGDPARFSIEVSVSKTDAVWKADIEMRNAEGASMGSRTVTSEATSCASLASAASLAMALLLERYVPAAPQPEAPPTPPPIAAPRPTPPSPKRAPAEESFPTGSIGILGAVASNVLPTPAFGIGIVADVSLSRRFDLTAGGDFFPEDRRTIANVDVAFSMTWGSLGGCYGVLVRGPMRVSGCASWVLGVMHSIVLSEVPWQNSEHLWTGAMAGAHFTWSPAGPVEIRVNLDALAPAARRTYAIQREPPQINTLLFTEPAVSAVASLGVGVRY
jgi:hypothetical protein